MPPEQRLAHRIKVNLTDEDYAQLQHEARARRLPLGPCLRAMFKEHSRTQLSREGTLLLEAIAEVRANHLDVLRKTLARELTLETLEDVAGRNRVRRRELAHELLGVAAEPEILSDTDEDDDEDPEGDN